jgi:hypothetical protein
MDKIFGEVDYVEAGEQEIGTKEYELDAYTAMKQQPEKKKQSALKGPDGGMSITSDAVPTV